MLHSSTRPLRLLPFIALAAGVLFSAICPTASRADSQNVGDARVGVYYLGNTGIRNTFTSAIATAGLDYYLGEETHTSRSILGVDYIQRSSGSGTKLQIIPVTISQQYYHTIGGTDFTPYGEAGIGAYFVSLQEANSSNLTSTHSLTSLGGFIGGGIDLSNNVFLDLRYHLIGNLEGQNPSGYELTAGFRF